MKQNIHTVVFDLDNTLIDTEAIKEALKDAAEEYGIDREEAWGAYLEARADRQGNIKLTPETYVAQLQKKFPDRGVDLHGIYGALDKSFQKPEDLLLPGARELLETCKDEGLNIYLLSLGVEEWQRDKIQRAGLFEFFQNDQTQDEEHDESGEGTVIFTGRIDEGKVDVLKEQILDGENGEGVVFFNDKPSKREADDILDAFPEITILLRKDERDVRYENGEWDVQVLDDLREKYGDRFEYAETLGQLANRLETLLDRGENYEARSEYADTNRK
ncbi:hypothetical protein C0581_04730 [Candidatus Parcubacteria bacterium]|nr:MAG: hypothetical protein C0581_04730 [Candidatus Parcubacteria bacterium]